MVTSRFDHLHTIDTIQNFMMMYISGRLDYAFGLLINKITRLEQLQPCLRVFCD